MWRLIFMLLGTGLVAWLAYLPTLGQSARLTGERTSLQLDMQQVHSQLLDRDHPDQRLGFVSQQLQHDEATQQTLMTPFTFSAQSANTRFDGNSHSALLNQQQLTLQGEVRVIQRSNEQQRTLYSQQLLLNWDTHLLHSPTPIELIEGEQHIHADTLRGNYQEGWYEFTNHVQTHWH